MNGNRGAKGSIRDRLISMLYRNRYKKKILQATNYTIPKKDKQIKYLNKLLNFGEKSNIDILDNEDKKILSNVKYTATFKSKKGIGLELEKVESKTTELDEVTNIKKETKKVKNEIVILKEVNLFVKKTTKTIDEINIEIFSLRKQSQIKNKDTKQLEEKYKKIKDKISDLKTKYEILSTKYDLSEFSIVGSIRLMNNIENYKTLASLNEMDMLLKACKNEIDRISGIKVISKESKSIEQNIDDTKQMQQQIKIEFIKDKDKSDSLNSMQKSIETEIHFQQQIVEDMYKEASFLEKSISKKVEYITHGKILSSLVRIAGGILTIPLNGLQIFGIALGTAMINKGLKQINKSIEKKEKIVINYKYEDISDKLTKVKDKVEYTNLILLDSLNETKKLKINMNNNYSEFKEILPNYNEMLDKLDSLESKLIKEQNKILKINNNLEEEREINKQKLKKIKNL